ncbi:MAG TPA: TIGR03435 family protein [Bryobacteraceae bacterium]|nr:TIGR03435 family protein [Bryobacteraceae bacterium]
MRAGIAVLGAVAAMSAFGQAPARPAFEVATIRPSGPIANIRPGAGHFGIRVDAQRVDIGTMPLLTLICDAYQLRPYQVSAPDWTRNTLFDIQATIPGGVSPDRLPEMLQSLLEERFGLKTHHESKDQSVYALVVGKDGPKMKESAPDTSEVPPLPNGTPAPSMSIPTLQGEVKMTKGPQGIVLEMPGKEIVAKVRAMPVDGKGSEPRRIHLESSGLTMKAFAELLSVGLFDRPVVDMTNLKGGYEVGVDLTEFEAMGVVRTSLSFLPIGGPGGDGGGDKGGAVAVASDPSGAALRPSITKLGLALEPRKLPLDLLVVDSVSKTPTEN